MLDEDLKPCLAIMAGSSWERAKGTGYHPIATNPEDRQREVLFAYADLANELNALALLGAKG